MSYLTADHTDAVTYWAPEGFTAHGLPGFAAPVALMARWMLKNVLFRSLDGREVTSEAVVLLGQDVQIGGKLLLGTSTELTPPSEAKEIRGFSRVQEIAGTGYQRKAML